MRKATVKDFTIKLKDGAGYFRIKVVRVAVGDGHFNF